MSNALPPCCPSPQTTAVAVMFYAPHSCVALCMVPHRPESTSVTCNPVQSRVFLPEGASVHLSFTCCCVCMQSRSYTFSVCKIVMCVCEYACVCGLVCAHVCAHMCAHECACVSTCVCAPVEREEDSVYLLLCHTLPFLFP